MAKPKPQRKEISDDRQSASSHTSFVRRVRTDDIAERAYALYLARGTEDGHDVEDWLQAERELLEGAGLIKPH